MVPNRILIAVRNGKYPRKLDFYLLAKERVIPERTHNNG